MSTLRLFQTALGIETGDIVKTSYNSGPYEVLQISRPYHIMRYGATWSIRVYRQPACSLTCTPVGKPYPHFYLNHIRVQDGRYLTDAGDEIFIVQRAKDRPGLELQIDLFNSYLEPVDAPYAFQPGVDYASRSLWHCDACGCDFNAERIDGLRPNCLRCSSPMIWTMTVVGHD